MTGKGKPSACVLNAFLPLHAYLRPTIPRSRPCSDANIYLEEGTRENPIPILSTEAERVVGISLPDDAEIRWFTLRKGELVYDPDTCNFFALKQVTQDEVDEWVKRAESAFAGGKYMRAQRMERG